MISLEFDLSALTRAARAVQGVSDEDLPFACAYALTKAMGSAKEAEIDTMRQVFDRPTRYTLNAFAVIPATKEKLSAELYVREFGGTPAWKYLGPQIHGGSRHKKGFERALERAGILRSGEYAVPTRFAPLDGNGNMRTGMLTRILSDVGANPDPLSNTSAAKRQKRQARGKGTYFVVRGRGKLRAGIYFRLGQRDIRPILLFTGPPNYSARFPYYEVARSVVPRAAAEHFLVGWKRYVIPNMRRRLKAA
jgi:hypothetical protein